MGVLRALGILEYLVSGRARCQVLKNQNVISVQDQAVSNIDETDKMKELHRAIGINAPKSKREKKIISTVGNLEKLGINGSRDGKAKKES